MRTTGLIAITAAVLVLIPPGFCADTIAWGSTVDGLRLGAAFGTDSSKPTMRVLFENVSSAFQGVVIGHQAGGVIYDSLKFVATAPDGTQLQLLHRSLYTNIAGLLLPFSVGLKTGESYKLEFPLKEIIYASGTTITLEDLVRQGYSIRVRFEATMADAGWARLAHPWVGAVSSAEVSQVR